MIKINLLPPRPRKGLGFSLPTLPGLGLLFGTIYAVVIVLIVGYWFYLNGAAGSLAVEIARIEAETARHKAAIAEGSRFKKEKEDLERRVALIERIARDQGRPIYLLDALADAVPADVWLTGMEEKEQVLKISGSAFSPTSVADFMANLKNSGKFKDVDLVVSKQDLARIPRVVTFEVTCRFSL